VTWTVGSACRVVEHDPVTRQPKEGGKLLSATVVRLTDSGLYVQVSTEHLGLLSFWAESGWHSFATFRWKLLPGTAG
jgi:hypothetical protein